MKYEPDKMLDIFHLSESEKVFFRKKIFENEKWRLADAGCSYRDVLFCEEIKSLPEKLQKVFYALVARYDFELKYMPMNEGIEEIISELKENGYRIYLLSNIGFGFHYFIDKIPVLSLFDGFLPSCDVGVIKPDKKIYEALFERFALVPSECVFIDDTYENIESGKAFGMQGIQYNAIDQNVSELRNNLVLMGILQDN